MQLKEEKLENNDKLKYSKQNKAWIGNKRYQSLL
jgi:hypothetical protein